MLKQISTFFWNTLLLTNKTMQSLFVCNVLKQKSSTFNKEMRCVITLTLYGNKNKQFFKKHFCFVYKYFLIENCNNKL